MAQLVKEKEGSLSASPQGLPEGSHVTVVRKNWGTDAIPANKVDYLDMTEFHGGVAHNVPRSVAEAWAQNRRLGLYFLPDGADEAAIMKATGIVPLQPETFSAMIRAYPVDELVTLLGEEKTLELANNLRKALGKAVKQ